jgi:hypothetical protein
LLDQQGNNGYDAYTKQADQYKFEPDRQFFHHLVVCGTNMPTPDAKPM